MADTDLPKNWEGAARWFLGGTIVFASGFEAVVLFWEGKLGAAASSFVVAIILMAILIYWDGLKSKMPRLMTALSGAVADARLWAVLLLTLAAFAGIPNYQREPNTWIYVLPLFIGLILFLAGWRYLGPIKQPLVAAAQSTAATQPLDTQTRLDLIHLLDFSVNETTYWMLDRLLDTADSPEVTDGFSGGVNTVEAHNSRQFFLGHARQEIGAGTIRRSEFENMLRSAEVDAERELEATPQDQRPAEIDSLVLRRYMISDLQFRRAILFIRHQRREMRDKLVGQRHRLVEFLQQRSP
ncbi:hypothetical protein [Bradyrhizobium sp. CCGUVB23]|uniref:hypothetical protein n=1 Tax=Bradyrhizobium sp. CCGUVB23 TaxID=2949630 RepID=UPI0020B2F96B|nr:hypothetical protein [Bradyrhizobium sp. CCGUVB23]MCP3463493.1 hypothetical protein [Bradyrhizobium sp. CCGUVB23]